MRLLPATLILLALLAGCNQKKQIHTFEIKDGRFVYDGNPVHIYSGEMHYARIPHEYWKHRLQMARAMGLNTIVYYPLPSFSASRKYMDSSNCACGNGMEK